MHYSYSHIKGSASLVSHLLNLNFKTLIKLTEILSEINDLNLVPHIHMFASYQNSLHLTLMQVSLSFSTRVVLFFQ